MVVQLQFFETNNQFLVWFEFMHDLPLVNVIKDLMGPAL
jgi:hypothetical protein